MLWQGDRLLMLDQRRLPSEELWIELKTVDEIAKAIRDMVVRGAPAIGIAAAYGMAIAAKHDENLAAAKATLAASRPTAVNLFWALDRIERVDEPTFDRILAEAIAIEKEDLEMNLKIGANGAAMIGDGANILTICNTGGLATAGHGTALGMIRTAHSDGKNIHVWSCETRPRQQGLRLTAFELIKEGIPFHSIADGAAASLMGQGKVDCVVVGADRIARNGDTANKIGTYMVAVLAKHHNIPFYVAAPSSTIDGATIHGRDIEIEERSGEELTHIEGRPIGPYGCQVYNPAFDVTPGELITGIVTEEQVYQAPYDFSSFQN